MYDKIGAGKVIAIGNMITGSQQIEIANGVKSEIGYNIAD